MDHEETKPYDAVINAYLEWQESNLESVQKMFEFAKSSESELKKAVKYLANITSSQTQSDREMEVLVLSAYERLIDPTWKGKMPRDISDTAELLAKLVKGKKTEAMLRAIRRDFGRYRNLQKEICELRTNADEPEEEGGANEYLSLHQLVIEDNQQFPATGRLCKATLCLRIIFLFYAKNKTLQDDDDRVNESLSETENANHELTSDRIKKILADFFENDMMKAEQLAKFWPSEIQEAALDEVMEIVSQLKSNLMGWLPQRLKTVELLREMAEDLHTHNKNVDISKIVASGTGIFATVLAIIGIGLTPVTFGASLGLTITGAALGGASAITHIGSGVTKRYIDKDKLKRLEELIEKDTEELEGTEDKMRHIEKDTEELEGTEDKMRHIEKETEELEGTEDKMIKRALKKRLFKLHAWVQAYELSAYTNETNDAGRDALRVTLPVYRPIGSSLPGASCGAFAYSSPLWSIVASAGAAASRVALGVGGALSVLTLPLDIASIVLLAKDLKSGAKCATGEEFARMADKFEAEAKSIQSLIEYYDVYTSRTYKLIMGLRRLHYKLKRIRRLKRFYYKLKRICRPHTFIVILIILTYYMHLSLDVNRVSL